MCIISLIHSHTLTLSHFPHTTEQEKRGSGRERRKGKEEKEIEESFGISSPRHLKSSSSFEEGKDSSICVIAWRICMYIYMLICWVLLNVESWDVGSEFRGPRGSQFLVLESLKLIEKD